MLQSTIGELLDGKLNDLDTGDHYLYLVRDGGVVFYVGRSQYVPDRLLAHMGKGPWGWRGTSASTLGQTVEQNLPESLAWQIELFTPGECGVEPDVTKAITKEAWEKKWHPDVLKMLPWRECQGQDSVRYTKDMIAYAEELLIAKSHPCLNTVHNHDPGTLPLKYYNRGDASKRRAPAVFSFDLSRLNDV